MIIAREVNPSYVDFSSYFDDDGLTNKGGDNCACYIVQNERYGRLSGFQIDEYKDIISQAEQIINDYDNGNGIGNNNYQYTSLGELLYHNQVLNSIHNTVKIRKFKEWLNGADASDTDSIAQFLTITTGEKWEVKAFCGYCQGDYCEIVYCPAHYTPEHINEIGHMWLGCGTEFEIDGCYGFFVIDELRWKEGEELRKYLADYYGCESEELEIYLYDGEHKVADYKLMTA